MSLADQISLYILSIKIFRFFCQKEEYLPLLFLKMLESLKNAVIILVDLIK